MNIKVWLLGVFILFPSIVWGLVGDQAVESSQIACSISVCKLKGPEKFEPIYTHQLDYEKCMKTESDEVAWLREEQIGESEDHVRYIFESIYGSSESNPEKNFATLAKLNWSCDENRNQNLSRISDTSRPLFQNSPSLRNIDPKYRWDSHNYDEESGVHTFSGLGIDDGELQAYISVHSMDSYHNLCAHLGFGEFIDLRKQADWDGRFLTYRDDGSYELYTQGYRTDYFVDLLQCRGSVVDNSDSQ